MANFSSLFIGKCYVTKPLTPPLKGIFYGRPELGVFKMFFFQNISSCKKVQRIKESNHLFGPSNLSDDYVSGARELDKS